MNTRPLRPPARRVLRTALEVLVAIAALVPTFVGLLGSFGIHVDGPAIVAIAGAAVLVATTVVAVVERAGSAPVIRTIVQVVVAVAGIVPAVVAGLAKGGIHVDEAQLALITGAAVMVATTVQNLLEHRGTIPTFAAGNDGGPPCVGCGPVAPHGVNPELIDDGEAR